MTEPDGNKDLELLLDFLRRSRGFDFTGYKRTSLSRRIDKRVQAVGADSLLSYMDHLEVDPEEFIQLFNTILVNVTSFFRDPPNWEYLSTEILPQLAAGKREDEPIRIWSAGCASGEEAYTLAMVTAEALGPKVVRERVKIYATDADEEALNQARQARYTAKQVEGVPADLLERYFERNGTGYVFSQELRRSVIFGRHDLIQDAPISRIDLLVCRNTLMYLNSETQSHVLARFAFALRDRGYLMLGKAEMLLAHSDLFTALDLKHRVFRKIPGATLRDRLMVLTEVSDRQVGVADPRDERIRTAAFESGAEAQLVVDAAGYLVLANTRARSLFDLGPEDITRPFQDLEVSYRPLELRSKIQQAYVERRPSPIFEVEWPDGAGGEATHLEVQVLPLTDVSQALLGASINFTDVTRSRRYKEELEHANQGLEDAYAELQSTNEELETTNEELQSTVEELETTNEELQSTNEELETMNEEMQSTNEELQTINDELGQRTSELNQLNAFLESIWSGLGGAVAVLDPDMRVLVWNHGSEDLWGVRQEEVQGQHFLNLDIGLPLDQIRPALRAAMSGDDGAQATVVNAINRRGKTVLCRVTCTPLIASDKTIRGVIVVAVEEQDRQPPIG
jgi:two-component system, chemotaxis family, CheB/CheR fusion protein